jgi:hypothetical protein
MRNVESNPLAEVFGFPIENESAEALSSRRLKLCPYNNGVPECTKDRKNDPLGVCSVHHQGEAVITCPVRFRENFLIFDEAAKFFFEEEVDWGSVSEVELFDINDKKPGNIDYVLFNQDDVTDFGSIEVQGVYITGNVGNAFKSYMSAPSVDFNWKGQGLYPRADYLSSIKRLISQMLSKGSIFTHWKKKQAVVIQTSFFNKLPALKRVSKDEADIAWFLYDMEYNEVSLKYHLVLKETVYTLFKDLVEINSFLPGEMANFVEALIRKRDGGSKKKRL